VRPAADNGNENERIRDARGAYEISRASAARHRAQQRHVDRCCDRSLSLAYIHSAELGSGAAESSLEPVPATVAVALSYPS
jgi:hypothetical protein